MSEAELILPNMRGGCVRVGNKVHTLFRLTSVARTLPRAAGRSGMAYRAAAAQESASTVSSEVVTS